MPRVVPFATSPAPADGPQSPRICEDRAGPGELAAPHAGAPPMKRHHLRQHGSSPRLRRFPLYASSKETMRDL